MLEVSGDRLDLRIIELKGKLNSPDLAQAIANDLAESLGEAYTESGLEVRSGAGIAALTYVGEVERVGTGWSIGVGNRDALGDESEAAPEGTLREFFGDNPELRPTPWRGIPYDYQQKLAAMRRAGMYGGRGADYANYMWVQDRGSPSAYISGRGFIDNGVAAWRTHTEDIISEWWKSIGVFGRAKRTVLGLFRR